MVQNGSKWSKMVPNCPKWSQMVQNIPKWSKRVQNGQKQLEMFQNDPKWSKTAQKGLKLSKMVKNSSKWSKNFPEQLKMVQNGSKYYLCKMEGKTMRNISIVATQCCSCSKGVCKEHHHILCHPCAKSFVDGCKSKAKADESVKE